MHVNDVISFQHFSISTIFAQICTALDPESNLVNKMFIKMLVRSLSVFTNVLQFLVNFVAEVDEKLSEFHFFERRTKLR